MLYRKLFLFCIILSLGMVTGSAIGSRVPDQISNIHLFSKPDPAREMQLQDIHGKPVAISGLRGKVVILNFWKIDCPPCSMEKPILERIYRKYASRGLEIVAVNLFDHQDDLRAYGQRGRFSFTLAYDPAQQFSTKRFAVGSGSQTTFIVNQHSQAIYEVSGVPTTYVIDRNGKVVANAVGMVNWEDPQEAAFLESLLQPGAATIAAQFFQSPEHEIGRPSGDEVTSPDRLAQSGSDNSGVYRQAQFRDSEQFPPVMAQQGPVQNPMPSVTGIQSPQSPAPVRVAPPQQEAEKQQGTKRKLSVKQPKPAVPVSPGSRKPVPYQPGNPPSQAPLQPGVQSGSLPALPPALPYTPQRGQRPPAPPIVPDTNGTVTARIPGDSGSQGYGSSLPAAQPLSGNPIDKFILDSFGRPSQTTTQTASPRPIGVTPPQAQERTQQPATVIQQIGQDFQNLGAGIKDTFSRMWPGR